MQAKQDLRRQLRRRRRCTGGLKQRLAAHAAARRLIALPEVRRARHIAVFLATDGELDPAPFARLAHTRGAQIYLPALAHGPEQPLHFMPWHPGRTPLARNRFGILEPRPEPHRRLPRRQLDVIVVPLVAFDARGFRLGMGGGFYDRSLAFIRRGWRGRRPRLIAAAYDFQRVAELPTRHWDVPLDIVVTERKIYRTNR